MNRKTIDCWGPAGMVAALRWKDIFIFIERPFPLARVRGMSVTEWHRSLWHGLRSEGFFG